MPILAEEANLFPDNLFDLEQRVGTLPEVVGSARPAGDFVTTGEPIGGMIDSVHSDDIERQWWAIYAKSRQEKALARQLLANQVPFYLPLVPKKQFIGGRAYCSHLPLFPGYLFAFATDQQRVCALATKRISRVLPVSDGAQLVSDLRQVKRLIDAKVPLTVEGRLKTGDRVRVRHGALGGLEGTVVRRSRKTRLIISVNYLQQGVSIEIDDYMLEPN